MIKHRPIKAKYIGMNNINGGFKMSNFIKITTKEGVDMLIHKDRIIAVKAVGQEPISKRPLTQIYVKMQTSIELVEVYLTVQDIYMLLS